MTTFKKSDLVLIVKESNNVDITAHKSKIEEEIGNGGKVELVDRNLLNPSKNEM